MMYQREAALAKAGGVALPPEPKGAMPRAVCGPGGSHQDRCLRTIPPRENGGNMDVKQMQKGTVLLLPCFVKGCLLSIGDVHYAQGDGEVSGTAIEMAATVTVKVEVRKGLGAFVKQPHFEGGDQLKQLEPSAFYATVGYPIKQAGLVPPTHQYLDGQKIAPLANLSEDVTLAARDALIQMVDWIARTKGLTREQAYCLASVARLVDTMPRRRVLVVALASLALVGHSPYRQWQVFRKSRLIVVTSAADPASWELGEAIARLLASELPDSRAMASRAVDAAAIVSLLASRQLDVGLLAPDQAREALLGRGRFAQDGPVPLRALARVGGHLFVCREDFPAPHAWQIARALAGRWPELPASLVGPASGPEPDASSGVPVHGAALDFYRGRPLPAAPER